MSEEIALILPCYNEEKRLDPTQVQELLEDPRVSLILVDDGSRDGTRRVLEEIRERNPSLIEIVALTPNRGKGEAVRRGLLRGIEKGASIVAFADSDFATPPGEILRVIDTVADQNADGAIGSRIALAGSSIERSAIRHYLGRVFATAASLALQASFYDTQCGSKAFRVTPRLKSALATPFISTWAFDVELLSRLLASPKVQDQRGIGGIVEVPLREWRDIAGSKLKAHAMLRAAVDVLRIGLRGRGGK